LINEFGDEEVTGHKLGDGGVESLKDVQRAKTYREESDVPKKTLAH